MDFPRLIGDLYGAENAVASPRKSLDVPRRTMFGCQSLADYRDVLREVRLIDHAVRPERRHQFALGDYLARILHQYQERLDRFPGQVDGFIPFQQYFGCGVEPEEPESKYSARFQLTGLSLDFS